MAVDVVRDSRSRQDLSVRVLPNHRPDELAMDSAVKFYCSVLVLTCRSACVPPTGLT
jgi:hypothetical protein